MTANASANSSRMHERDPVQAACTPRVVAGRSAACKADLRRENADRRAIERGEDEGMAIHARMNKCLQTQ